MTTIEEGLRFAVKSLLNVTHTCLPGVIITYDYKTQKATVQPSLRKVYQSRDANGNNVVQDMPILNGVPVIFPRSGSSSMAFPVNEGDRVLVLVSERSLDQWISSNDSQVTPADPRQFHLADAVCLPGLYPFSDPLPLKNNQDFVINHEGSSVTIKGDGEIDIKTASTVAIGTSTAELLDLVSQLMALLQGAVVMGPAFNGPLNTAFTTQVGILQGKLDGIKGMIT